jgi:hypothetical protein
MCVERLGVQCEIYEMESVLQNATAKVSSGEYKAFPMPSWMIG